MKANFNTLIGIATAGIMALSCSAPKYASAQQPDEGYNNQPPAQQGEAYDDQGANVEAQQDVDFNTFYDALSPYGTWEDDPNYGQVWVSNEADFTPYYSNGNWAYTDAGWTWVSNYNWGWAPFHYGRWAFNGHWMWVPGYEWAPAWVSWRTGGDYYGWAPLMPGISIGVGAGYGGYIPAERWNFCPRAYITSGSFNRYCVDRRTNFTVIRNTTIINNVNSYHNARFVAGPDRHEVERFTNRRIDAMPIRNANRPGAAVFNRGSVQMYRPNVRPGTINRPQQQHNMQQPNNNRQQQQFNNRAPQQSAPAPYRPSQQPVNNQPRQTIRNIDRQQNAVNNNRYNATPDNRIAYNQPRTEQARPQVQQNRPQPQYRQQERFSAPQQQFNRPQPQQFSRPQAQPQQRSSGNGPQRGGRR